MDACESNLGEACRLLGFILSSLGTVEALALRCMRSGDAREQELRPRAHAARERAGAAYDGVATSRGHLGAAARIFARGDLPRSYVDREVLAANTAIAAALEQLQGVEAALGSSGNMAPPHIAMPHGESDTRPAAAAAHRCAKTARAHDDAWRALARSSPGALLDGCAALPELEAAHAELGHCAHAFKSSPALDHAAAAGTYAALVRALDAAHAAISRVLFINGGVSTAFLVATAELGLERVEPQWLSWEESRSDVGRHGRAALDLLWSASACVDCHFGCVVVGPASSSCDQLLRGAVAEAGEAREAAKLMVDAGIRLSLDTSGILNGV